ncbi:MULTISPECIES: VanZ family protein [Flavobacterium]|uniref:VanZ family protein n=1 Tax=Flavobacterium covae TaxID=2906076 RepID=A0ABW8PEB0_9FLAO|nr:MULTISPECIES: VanZ family protein [Flavobacterium]MCH4828318.1 VanZ family protein [Flavobacterium columnare]MCH4834207.1 VanZ family protein [Flavobacterium columnare]MCJ1807275.1 VanZ family protein [Flavobacterium covae]MCJ1809417.1 VanZ family protein [Flavobacterium covae]
MALCWTFLILFLSFKAPTLNPKYTFPNEDKVVHFVFYFVFVFLWIRYIIVSEDLNLKKVIVLTIIAILISILVEIGQAFLTINRSAEIQDIIANSLGAISSAILSYRFFKK